MAEGTIRQRVERAASSALERDQHVTAIDILTGLRWLSDSQVDLWRQGRVEYLLQEVQTNPDKVVTAMEFFVQWAKAKGLVPSEAAYVARTPDRRQLRFTPSSNPAVELVFCTHWLSPDLSDSKRAALIQAENSPPELVVVMPLRDFVCTGCGGSGDFLIMQDDGPLCLTCAQIDDLVFLPSGNARLTRRAAKASERRAVVVRRSRTRQRYERQGLLVEQAALEQAEQQCLAIEQDQARARDRSAER